MGIFSNIFSSDNVAGKIIVNGEVYEANGGSVTITSSGRNSRVIIGDKVVGNHSDVNLNVSIMGDCRTVETNSGDVKVSGSVGGKISTVSGDVNCGNVEGSVSTVSGDVEANDISGSVSTISGDIEHI
jgi:hypothetical protein